MQVNPFFLRTMLSFSHQTTLLAPLPYNHTRDLCYPSHTKANAMSGFGDKLRGKMKNFADMGVKGHKNVTEMQNITR